MNILVIEDDDTLAMGVEYSLKKEGFQVLICDSLSKAKGVNINNIDLILLDVSLPDGNGFEYCNNIRSYSDVPIIFLTACDEEANVVQGLDMGGDDYLTKPIRIRELISRINAVLRRRGRKDITNESRIKIRDLIVDTKEVAVYKNGDKITLTTSEYKLLIYLLENKGVVLTRRQLLENLWDITGDFIEERTLNVYIKRLREKIGDEIGANQYIETIRGVGYRWIE